MTTTALGDPPVIEVRGLRIELDAGDERVPVTRDVTFQIAPGRVLALVGESGCGKSVTALSLLQLLGRQLEIAAGEIRFSAPGEDPVDIAALGRNGRRIESIRGARISMIFQEPMSSFSPILTIGRQIAEVAEIHERLSRRDARARAVALLGRVGIPEPEAAFDRYPDQFSGGMRQRAMIAKALICRPALLVADEPTTALDVTIQAQILDLLKELQAEFGMAILFITHDLGIVAQMADEVAIMYAGEIVEAGPVERIFLAPAHPYTRALLDAVPRLGDLDRRRRLDPIPGSVPGLFDMPSGCRFQPRCGVAVAGLCELTAPRPVPLGQGQTASCHLAAKGATP